MCFVASEIYMLMIILKYTQVPLWYMQKSCLLRTLKGVTFLFGNYLDLEWPLIE